MNLQAADETTAPIVVPEEVEVVLPPATDDGADRKIESEPTPPSSSILRKITSCLQHAWQEHDFLIMILGAILLARAYPPLGADYLQPDITATWLAVVFTFFLAGLTLKTSEFANALAQLRFNVFVQIFNFGVVSALVYVVSRALKAANILSQDLADGMVIGSTLPMTINTVVVMTKSAGGDEASAIFNSAFGNFVGVFLSPLLILGYLGVSGNIDLADVFYKLTLRVLVPVIGGQIVQYSFTPVKGFMKTHKSQVRMGQQWAITFITYTVFCKTFQKGSSSSIGDVFIMIVFQFLLLAGCMALAWYTLKILFANEPKLRVMGLFGCTHKTIAVGVPLINAIYGDNSAVGLFTLPLLVWHPMQLVLGTFLTTRLAAFVKSEKQRLGLRDDDDDTADDPRGETADETNGPSPAEPDQEVLEEGRLSPEEERRDN